MPDLATQRSVVDEVDECPLPVDLDHRQPFPVARFELRVATDVALLELEPELVACRPDDLARPLAAVAADRVVQNDSGCYG